MQELSSHISHGYFTYDQIERHGALAVYRQTHNETVATHYEVIKIRVAAAHTFPDGHSISEREVYPPAKTWGTDGWTFYTLDAARDFLAQRRGVA